MSDYDPAYPILREMLAMSILNKLDECGFKEDLGTTKAMERVYYREIPKTRMRVQVFTTIVGQEVRHSGKDSIRICASYRTKEGAARGIGKATRVHRVGNIEEIVDRMHGRMRTTWKMAATGERCRNCGAPKFISKNGNKVCAEICWKK